MIFGIKFKLIISTHTMYCWLLLQLYPATQVLCSSVTDHMLIILLFWISAWQKKKFFGRMDVLSHLCTSVILLFQTKSGQLGQLFLLCLRKRWSCLSHINAQAESWSGSAYVSGVEPQRFASHSSLLQSLHSIIVKVSYIYLIQSSMKPDHLSAPAT